MTDPKPPQPINPIGPLEKVLGDMPKILEKAHQDNMHRKEEQDRAELERRQKELENQRHDGHQGTPH